MTYGIIGVGSIATAIVTGLCEHAQEAPAIVLSPRNATRAADLAFRFPTVRVAQNNQDVIDGASVLLLCLRPQDAGSVLRNLNFSGQHAIISVVAGMSIDELRGLVSPAQSIARAIPLPSVAAREGATPIYPSTEAARALFDRLGKSIDVPNAGAFEATSASTATVAAHFAYLNTICQWLIAQGLSSTAARDHVAATFAGLATPLRGQEPDFGKLAHDHATPGGINELFRGVLEEAGVFDTVDIALKRVLDRLTRRSSR